MASHPPPSRPRAAPPLESILDAVGGTPVVRLRRLAPAGAAAIYAKLESFNPGGSVKDRIALSMVEAAEREGRLAPYRLTLVMPESTALEHRQALAAYGAEVILTPAADGIPPTVARATEVATREGALLLQQFENPANPAAHREGTGPELALAFESAGALPDAFVAGVGTGGTISGVSGVLRRARPGVLVVAVEPASCAILSGGPAGPTRIQGLGAGFVPPVLDRHAYDRVIAVTDEDAWAMKQRLAREEGLLVGISSGAAAAAALRVARDLGPAKIVATVFADTGERYFSMEEWFAPRRGEAR